MDLKLKKPIVFFDLETTGTSVINDRIVQISYIKVMPNGEEIERDYYVNPGMHIPEEASAVHHIYDKDVADKPTFKQLASGLAKEFEWRLTPLVVEYGSHTKVEFSHGDIVTIGKRSSFVDFGVSSKFKIIELKEGANKAYWEKCWFASCLIGDDD